MKSHQANPFPRLKQQSLKEHIAKMVKTLGNYPITKVMLYEYDRWNPEEDQEGKPVKNLPWHNQKAEYALLFVLDGRGSQTQLSVRLNLINLQLGEKRESEGMLRSMGIGQEFASCYELEPGPQFVREWNFFSMIEGDDLPVGVKGDGPCWNLCSKVMQDYDAFIKALRVKVINDSEISIQKGKSAITYGCESMGFKNKKVKTWKLFLTLLKSPHLVELPKRSLPDGRQSNDYNREIKLLRDLNAKLVAFFNKTYPIELLKDYKLYQRDKSEREGTYRLVFSPKDSEVASRFEKMSQDTLLKTIDELSRKCKELPERNGGNAEDKYLTDFNDACMAALKKKWITEEEINRLYPIKGRDMRIKEVYEAEQGKYDYVRE